ncbi:hypothetical protein [Rhizobium laguerreae]|jgi:K+ transporter|uniref:hypothetical protein n=1 Tax=Rhizobium laguerreae TaxID=1076926 RepID=UPI001C9228DC|nr:hypothetical protein [Rhizobium laguerreae]MBY3231902.1 hypothetical protein [Rhizobium laguerreae]
MRVVLCLLVLTAYVAVGHYFFQSTLAQIFLGGAGVAAAVAIFVLMRNDDEAVDP